MTLFLQDEWLTAGDVDSATDCSLSWATRISRTRVSTVDGLNFTNSVGDGLVQSLEGVIHAVQRLKITNIPFQEIEEIDEVGQGKTFKVSRCRLKNAVVAVKHIQLEGSDSSSEQRSFHRRLQSVTREVIIMHHPPLSQHPNILRLLGYGWQLREGRPAPYVIVEYGSAGSLRKFLTSTSQPLRAKMILAGDVAWGLMALHSCGIVHGDLKLDNVVLFANPDRPTGYIAKLCDFGHSILTSDSPDKELYYYGSPLYNAPEVFLQASAPISRADLHKCDIWAFGLLVWEIILNGSRYFRKEWRHDTTLLRLTDLDYRPPLPVDDSAHDSNDADSSSNNDEDDTIFGQLDLGNLRRLAKQDVNNIRGTNLEFEKGYLRALLEKTLSPEPRSRRSDLASLPFISQHWNKFAMATALQANLAIHTGTSRFSYDLFRRENVGHVTWAHEVHILKDLETVCASSRLTETVRSALFHAFLCFVNAFGTSRDDTKAIQYLRKAEEQGHLMARLLRPRISDAMTSLQQEEICPYPEFLRRAFLDGRIFPWSQCLTVKWASENNSSNYAHYSSYSEASTALRRVSRPTTLTVEIRDETSLITMNLLETAIAFQDIELVTQVAYEFDPWCKGAWNESCFQQAARHGEPKVLCTLLNEIFKRQGSNKQAGQISEALCWLFCRPDIESIDRTLDLLLPHCNDINAVLPNSVSLHEQWPLKLSGTPLAVAVLASDPRVVKALLDRGADPLCAAFENDTADEIWTPLHIAVRNHQAALFEVMWTHVIEVSKGDPWKRLKHFPLPCALSYSTTVERLALHGRSYNSALQATLSLSLGSFDARSALGRTALLLAIDFEDFAVVDALLAIDPGLAKIRFEDPSNPRSFIYPLHFAAQVGSLRETERGLYIVRQLLALYREALKKRCSDGSTALHLAAAGTSSKIMQYLLDEGAATTIFDHRGKTALHNCRNSMNVRILLDHGADIETGTAATGTAMHTLAYLGLVEPTRELIRRGASVNAYCASTGSVIHAAIYSKSDEMVRTLIEAGADVNRHYDVHGRNALLLAIGDRLFKIAYMLLDAGAEPLAAQIKGASALQFALSTGALPLFRKMLGLVEKDISSQLWAIMIHGAIKILHKTGLQSFLEAVKSKAFFDVDVRRNSLTPLMVAAKQSRADVVALLLEHGADVNAEDGAGNTPILHACNSTPHVEHGSSRSSTCLWLIQNGADLLYCNSEGMNCLRLAQKNYDFELMTVLLTKADGMTVEQIPRRIWRTSYNSISKRNHLCKHADNLTDYFRTGVREKEWEFVTVCLAHRLVDDNTIHECFDFSPLAKDYYLVSRLVKFAQNGDRYMIERAAERSTPSYRYSDTWATWRRTT